MKQPIEYLVIEQVKDSQNAIVATNKFITPDSAYRQYKAKPGLAFARHGDNTPEPQKVYYKIKLLRGIRAIRKHKKILAAYDKIR